MRNLSLILAAFTCATAASAATVDVQVLGPDGHPAADAVVMIDSARAPAGPIHFPWPLEVKQQNLSFQPHVLVVPVGADVIFPNMDKVRHHVYSFSPAKKFQLKLYGREEKRVVQFDKPGVVPIGCNIHDQMSGTILVVNTPYAAVTDGQGRVSIADVPAGGATLRLWSTSIRGRDNQLSQPIQIAGNHVARTLTIGRP